MIFFTLCSPTKAYGQEYRWQFFELLSFAGGREPDDSYEKPVHDFPALLPATFGRRQMKITRR